MSAGAARRDFWERRRALVTGHTGFKGSWLSLWLASLGAHVVGVADGVPTDPSLHELARVDEDVEALTADVRDREAVERVMSSSRPEVVIHMAAQPLVRASYQDPVGTYETNVMGTVHVLEAARRSDQVAAVVVVTSDKVYENREGDVPYREDDPLGGRDPYSASKACAELATSAYRGSYARDGPAIASARAGNVIGGGDWSRDRLVPDVMAAALEGSTAVIRNPDAVRPWQHVLNPLCGYLRLAESLWESHEYAEAWNFGPEEGDAVPVRALVERLAAEWGEEIRWEPGTEPGPAESSTLTLDSSKAAARLGWAPRWGLEDAARSIAAFYRALAEGEEVRAVVLDQVDAFQSGKRPTR